MRKVIFKYFDTFCWGDLVEDDKDFNWVKPDNTSDSFGYSTETEHLFYNGQLLENVTSMFCIGRNEFKNYLGEWFIERYQLPVLMVL